MQRLAKEVLFLSQTYYDSNEVAITCDLALSDPLENYGICAGKAGAAGGGVRHGEVLQAAFWRQPYDLVLLDIEMPGTGGYELALVLKKQYKACEIVFITEHMELVLEAFRFKPAAFVPKGQLAEELPSIPLPAMALIPLAAAVLTAVSIPLSMKLYRVN